MGRWSGNGAAGEGVEGLLTRLDGARSTRLGVAELVLVDRHGAAQTGVAVTQTRTRVASRVDLGRFGRGPLPSSEVPAETGSSLVAALR